MNEAKRAAPAGQASYGYYANQDSALRTVTYGVSDGYRPGVTFGKLWYARGWLFWFRAATSTEIESFPPKYPIEVARRASEGEVDQSPEPYGPGPSY